MSNFNETTHLSEIIEQSNIEPVIIFKYSNDCNSSARLKNKFEKLFEEKTLVYKIYIVTVQIQKVLSHKIEEVFGIKHESPQIIVLNKGKVAYTAHHNNIKIENILS